MSNYPATPQHDKLKALGESKYLIHDFLDWLEEQSLYICTKDMGVMFSTFELHHRTKEQIMADFFNIDLKALSREKDDLYDHMQSMLDKPKD